MTDAFNVGITAMAGANLGIFQAKVTVSGELTWTNTSTWGNSSENTQTATLTISQPSPSYIGPTSVNVYYDTIYNTFMFQAAPL